MSIPSLNQPPAAQGSLGTMLQQARKAKQVSLEEAASELFILKRHLQALENESFSELPQVAFARGFAINYAKFLDLDPVKVATSFDAAYPNELKSHSGNDIESLLHPMGTLQHDTYNRIRFNPLLIIAVVVLIALAIFLFRMVSNASKDNNQEPTPAVDDISALEQVQGAAINNQSNGLGAAGSALNLNGAGSMSNASLQVKLTDAATISIMDASGSSLMNGLQTGGDYKLSGTPPFTIQIDKVDNVSIMLNEETVALDEYATDKPASFELMP